MHYGYYYGCLFLYWWRWVLVNLLKMVKVMIENVTIKVNGYNVDIAVSSYTEDELNWSVLDVDTDHTNLLEVFLKDDDWIETVEPRIVAELDKIKADKTTDDRHSKLSIDELTEHKQGLGVL